MHEEGGCRTVPAFEFLRGLPSAPRVQLLAIVDAVATVGPDRWKDRNRHRAMEGELAHLHEARDRHGQTLFRLFLRWQREQHRVVIIDGWTKPNATALHRTEYDAVGTLAATIDQDPPPFATADDFVRAALAEPSEPS